MLPYDRGGPPVRRDSHYPVFRKEIPEKSVSFDADFAAAIPPHVMKPFDDRGAHLVIDNDCYISISEEIPAEDPPPFSRKVCRL